MHAESLKSALLARVQANHSDIRQFLSLVWEVVRDLGISIKTEDIKAVALPIYDDIIASQNLPGVPNAMTLQMAESAIDRMFGKEIVVAVSGPYGTG